MPKSTPAKSRLIWDASRVEHFRLLALVMAPKQLAEHYGITSERVYQIRKDYIFGNRTPQPDAHGMTGTRIYKLWWGVMCRCYYPVTKSFSSYGGRGITICDRWKKFENFYADMGEPPPGMTLDRIDTNGMYCLENCRWATNHEQQRNRRNNVTLNWLGRSWILADLCTHLGLYSTHIYRLKKRGMPLLESIQFLVDLKEKRDAKINA